MVKVIKSIEQRNSIRVAIIGCVSSGKSTLLNSICVDQYEDMKRKKTTMLPSVYKSSNKSIYRNKSEKERIKLKNKEVNEKLYDEAASGGVITNENCKIQEYMIPLIENFVDLPENVFIDIYDIPGLNDCGTKDIYFKWVRDNFHEFDLILNVMSIENGCNTSDEKDILNLITDCIHNEKVKYDRNVLFLTVINKCDDMEIHNGNPKLIDEEDKELCKQIINTTKEVIKEKYGDQICTYGFVPITARDTFIYRMLNCDPESKLDITLLNKFGINEVGKKKWNCKYKTTELKRQFIKEYFSKNVNIEEILELTGYTSFTKKINSYLTMETQSLILINRLKNELKNEMVLNRNISKDVDEMKQLINLYNNYCIKVQTIDQIYKSNNSPMVTTLIYSHVSRWINEISDLSNDKKESIETLEEYKSIMRMLRNTIDAYALKNKIPLEISSEKETRWDESLGFKVKEKWAGNIGKVSLSKLFDKLYSGYSNLQNDFYIKQLMDPNNYNNFPTNIFPIIDKLNDNSCDTIEVKIDDIITGLKNTQFYYSVGLIEGPSSALIPGKTNCIKVFCEKLIQHFDYPEEKVIDFLKYYCLNRYKSPNIGPLREPSMIPQPHLPLKDGLHHNLEKSYTILLDDYLDGGVPMHNKYIDNLRIINKSYQHYSNDLCSSIDYCSYLDDVLCIPYYLVSLMLDNKLIAL